MMDVWKQSVRLGLVALCASMTVNCTSCTDDVDGSNNGSGNNGNNGNNGNVVNNGNNGNADNNSYDPQTGIGTLSISREPPKLDLLWVIDNSGSMCQEQAAIRENFSRLAYRLVERGVDFQLGVTTTQMDDYALEPVAQPGTLQSTPQPLPSPLPLCHGDAGDPDNPSDGYYPIRERIEVAIRCTKDPSAWQHLADVTDTQIECALNSSDASECGEYNRPEALFPQPGDGESPYREIPRVVRSTDYDAVNKVDIERMSKDFACMGLVGTRGSAVERGLAAAVKAVSPEMTGGTPENPSDASAPNHGFIREDAEFTVIFVTDENDCSHDGTLDTVTHCGDDVCAFANHPAFPDSPLIDPSELAANLVDNLSQTKGYQVSDDTVSVGSIHGVWKRYGAVEDYPAGTAPMDLEAACDNADGPPADNIAEQTSCDTAFGSAFSGDRYERFALNFPKTYPAVAGPDEHMDGLICQPARIAATLEGIAETLSPSTSTCISHELHSCGECPAYRFGDGTPGCIGDLGMASFCESAVEVQVYATGEDDPAAALSESGYCIAESIDAEGVEGGCVVDRSKYELTRCEGAQGVTLTWTEPGYFSAIGGFDMKIRYLTNEYAPESESDTPDAGF